MSRFNRLYMILWVCLVMFLVFQYVNIDERDFGEVTLISENQKSMDTLNGSECILPNYDLYDPEIRLYINQKPSPILCGNIQPYLVFLNWDGTLHLNQTEVISHNYADLKCSYCTVSGYDDEVVYGMIVDISSFPMTVDEPNIRVNCSNGEKDVYVMVHSQIKLISRKQREFNEKIPSHRPSVLIFVIDSMSRGNFIRTLPKTYSYLLNELNMTILEGFNKVADNSFSNMLALLSGFMFERRDSLPDVPIWSYKVNSTLNRNDDLPIVWKTFADSGYVTMYAEESLNPIFSLGNVGFLEDPVDYYYRFIFIALSEIETAIKKNRIRLWNQSTWQYCIGNQPSYKYMLNYTEEFLTKMVNLRYFTLSFFVQISHDYLTDVSNMDNDLVDFLTRMFENNILNNTVLLMMGDHGHRFDDIRKTYIGRIEERMPFVGMLLPGTLKKSHPHLQRGLDHHAKRLLSFYDLHETLVELAEDDLGEKPNKFRPRAIGKSILRPFDDERTCTQIGILPEYCMCNMEAQIPENSEKANISAMVVVEHINSLLKDSRQFIKFGETRRCAKLTLDSISSASMSMRSFPSGVSKPLIRVVLTALPSRGMFEAAVEQGPGEPPSVMGDVNRINKYDNQPDCILFHNILRMYCYCI